MSHFNIHPDRLDSIIRVQRLKGALSLALACLTDAAVESEEAAKQVAHLITRVLEIDEQDIKQLKSYVPKATSSSFEVNHTFV